MFLVLDKKVFKNLINRGMRSILSYMFYFINYKMTIETLPSLENEKDILQEAKKDYNDLKKILKIQIIRHLYLIVLRLISLLLLLHDLMHWKQQLPINEVQE